jgi:hypothetical protein
MLNPDSKFLTINLSDYKPTLSDSTLLEKGLSFIPTRKTLPISNFINDQNRLIRSLKLKSYFNKKLSTNRNYENFTDGSKWTPRDNQLEPGTLVLVDKIKIHANDTLKLCNSYNATNRFSTE